MTNEDTKILIVEDSPTQALLLEAILEKEGFQSHIARNGEEALKVTAEVGPALIITDIVMPKMDGYELCRRVKADPDLKEIPVILLTSLSDPYDVIRGLQCSADNFITKPYQEEFLLSRIRYILLNKEMRKTRPDESGVQIYFGGEKISVTSSRIQIVDLLFSSFENAVQKNSELKGANEALLAEINQRKKAEEQLKMLFDISTALSSLVDMDTVFKELVDIMMHLDFIDIEPRGSILLNKENRLCLTYDMGHDATFIAQNQDLTFDSCLCGIAAKREEVMISGEGHADVPPHVFRHSEGKDNQHIIIPLKSASRLVGVLCLSLKPGRDIRIDKKARGMLQIIGNQIGIALENTRLYEEAQKDAFHDPLTGLPNRRLLDIIAEKNFASAKRGMVFSVIMLDIDNFKSYNDTYGHPAGDTVLANVSNVAKRTLRGSDFIARYGGEEFVLLLSESDAEAAGVLAERLRRSVEVETEVTVSLGISTYQESFASIGTLIQAADTAMYAAKKNGKNRVEVYD